MAHYPLLSPNPWRPYWSSVPTISGVQHQNTATIKMRLQAPGSQATTLKQSCKATSWHDSGMYTSNRKHEPGHYMLTIKSFSLLSEAQTTKIESDVFEASGHKWRLDLYPNGDKAENEYSHISLYLILCGTESVSNGEEVCVDVNFFVYDHIAHTYVIFQDFKGNKIMFSKKKTKWGFDKLILLDSFKESGNGYLCNDSCVIGVEIFKVPKYTQKDQCLSLIKPPPTMNTHIWTIDKFSRVTEKVMYSDVFKVGKVNWRIALYPKGDDKKGTNMSMFLCVHDTASFPKSWRLCAIYKLRVKNQIGNVDREIEGEDWFCDLHDRSGLKDFMPLSELYDLANGFLLNRVLRF